jgi:RNA polymerase sigma factor (sigma-70 family)
MVSTIKDTDIEEIVEGCRNNDNVMQTKLYYLAYPVIYNTIGRYVHDDGDKEDILQETFIKAFNNIKKLKDEKVLIPWMKRISINLCMDTLRKNKKLNLSFDQYIANRSVESEDETDEFDVDSVADITMDDVNEVLDQLPLGFRTVFMLYAIENYSHKEIAQQIGTSESNSKTQYMRAKVAIKNLVKQKFQCKKMK